MLRSLKYFYEFNRIPKDLGKCFEQLVESGIDEEREESKKVLHLLSSKNPREALQPLVQLTQDTVEHGIPVKSETWDNLERCAVLMKAADVIQICWERKEQNR